MERKKQLIVKILVGIPGSGKSTYTKDFLRKNADWVGINRDSFRYMLRNEGWTEEKIESMITELVEIAIIKSLNRGLNVIIDATNLKRRYIEQFVTLVQYYADVEFLPFDVPLATCIERDKNREQTVGEDVIKKMYKDWLNIIDSDVFTTRKAKPKYQDRFIPMVQDKSLPEAVIFDIDGNISEMGNRSPYDWDRVDIDKPIDIVIEQINFHRNKGRKIIIVTGRDEICKEKTEYWLNFYGIYYDEIYMRGKDVMGKDTKIKKDIFNLYIKPFYHILCVYDDRISVVKMWSSLGIFCFCTNQGLKEF